MSLVEIVAELLENASKNGYDFFDQSDEDIADDMLMFGFTEDDTPDEYELIAAIGACRERTNQLKETTE